MENTKVLLACQTMQVEIEWVLHHHPCDFDRIIWVRSGLHNDSDSLHKVIQEELGRITNARKVILGFGACGNALAGIEAGDFEMILPKVDDCISLMLGSYRRKLQIRKMGETYFLTQGWLDGESNIYKEYLFTVKKYGKQMADIIYEQILGQYQNLGIIDTKVYDYESFLQETKVIAEDLKLKQLPIKGDLAYLEKLLTGPWNSEEFIHIAPFEVVKMEMFRV